jgi:hypothetical protein
MAALGQGISVGLDFAVTPKSCLRDRFFCVVLKVDQLKDILCVRCKYPEHINVLDGEALLLWLRWLLRNRANHSSRAVVLIDSAVIVGAAAKGRSSSRLHRVLRKLAVLQLGSNLQLHVILIPPKHNPADLPSRGKRRKRVQPAVATPSRPWQCCLGEKLLDLFSASTSHSALLP